MILAEIITIGDELLIGQVVDTNSAWIGQRLNEIGLKVKQISSVSDDETHILKALNEAAGRADVIIITGGLGPTKDDITKKTLCKYFNTDTKFDEATFKIIETIFRSRGREVTAINRKQAEVPSNCTVLPNQLGTAPGMWFSQEKRIYVSLPGVPSEMKGLMENSVLPMLKGIFPLPPIVHKTILTQGAGESFLAEKISQWEDNLPDNIKLAYLPDTGRVRLRLTASGNNEKELHDLVHCEAQKLMPIIGEYIYGYGDEKLETIVGELLAKQKKTLSTAESCTGGYIAHRITSVPGSSRYFIGSVVAYANDIKVNDLRVDESLIEKHGAVSKEVVVEMAKNIQAKYKTDCSIACSGIAGPDGGTPEKPVGTVWLAVCNGQEIFSMKLALGTKREAVINQTAQFALNILRKMLLGEVSGIIF